MINIDNNDGCKFVCKENESGYKIKFEVGFDSDTVTYPLKNNSSVVKLKSILTGTKIVQVLSEEKNVELLAGASDIGAPEVFFSLVDYTSEELEQDTKKVYTVNINRDVVNFDVFASLINLVENDISLGEVEDEHKLNTAQH